MEIRFKENQRTSLFLIDLNLVRGPLFSKSSRTFSTLKCLDLPRVKCKQNIFLQLLKSLTRSSLDYGALYITLLNKSSPTLFKPVPTAFLQLVLGSFRVRPKLNFIYSKPIFWTSSIRQSRQEEVILCRLSIDRSLLTSSRPSFSSLLGSLSRVKITGVSFLLTCEYWIKSFVYRKQKHGYYRNRGSK